MKNININQSNEFDQRTKDFFQTNLAERLAEKYREKSYQERFQSVYTVALVFSFLCNGVSIITASSFVFSYIIAIVYLLPYPHIISGIITALVLVTIESLQRLLAPRFFQNVLQYNKKNLIAALFLLSGISITFSYLGSPDFLQAVSQPPEYEAPTLLDIAVTKADYKEQIRDAKAEAEEYKKRKLWGGRLSDDNAKVYQQLLEKVASLRDQMNATIREAEQTNISLTAQAKKDFKQKEDEFNSEIASTGAGLGLISIISQLVFFLCIWYCEYYDFRVASQYALLQANQPTSNATTSNQQTIEHYVNQYPNTSEPVIIDDSTVQDFYTIEHISFRDGSTKRYNLQQIDGIMSVYRKRLTEAEILDDTSKIRSRSERLKYWGGLRGQLVDKLQRLPQLEQQLL